MREAEGAFGDPTVFIEQAVVDPRHIEVQILADGAGQRDPPLRARLLGAAPAPEGRRDRAGAEPRPASCASGCAPTPCASRREIGYRNAGTVEFLLDPAGQLRLHRDEPAHPGRAHGDRGGHRRRPRAVADADRLRRDPRRPRPRPGLDRAARRRAAVPDHHRGPGQRLPPRHRPDHDLPLPRRRRRPPRRRHDLHRRRGQRALRLDAGQADLPRPRLRRRRSSGPGARVAEFRIRGVSTNIPFLQAVLDDPDFRGRRRHHVVHRGRTRSCSPRGSAATAAPSCSPTSPTSPSTSRTARRRSTRRPGQQAAATSTCRCRRPTAPARRCCALGPEGFARRAARADDRSRSPTRPSATRTSRCSPPGCAPATCSPSPGTSPGRRRSCGRSRRGAVRRTTWRCASSSEDPWERLAALRQAVPNICLQMLLRGRNTVGYTPYPTEVTDAFVAGGRGHRHRRLPDLRRAQRRRADAARRSRRCARPARRSPRSRSATPATCPTRARSSTRSTTTCGLAERIVDAGAHVLAIKDMAGLLRAPAARTLVTALRERFDLPVHLHTHDTPGGQLATLLAAIDAGRRRRRRRDAPRWPAPPPSRRCRRWSPRPTTPPRETGLSLARGLRPRALLGGDPPGLRAVRVRACPSPTGRVYTHEIPGGQLSNLRQQAIALGLGEKFEQIEDMYAAAEPTSSATSSR